MILEIMERKKISKYRLAKSSGVPYTTVSDICNGNSRLEKCSAETVYRIAKVLGVSMEKLIEPCFVERISFELYKSNVCHRVKELGDIDFILETLEEDKVRAYYDRKWYPESLYLLAMLDYLSRINDIPLCDKYDDIRRCKLKETVYPSSVLSMTLAHVSAGDEIKERARHESIPEFMHFNIVESEVRNIV